MKSVPILLLMIGWSATQAGCATSSPKPAALAAANIVWTASTNDWPQALWVYKVVPQEFSPAVISNLLVLSSFTMKERTNMLDQPAFKDKTVLYFRNADQSKHLGIFPTLGWIDYNDRAAKSASQLQPVAGVPTPDEAAKLGIACLRSLGIDVSQLATKPGTGDLDLHWEKETIDFRDEQTKSNITLTNMCGVFFLRRIDGFNVRGIGLQGGAEISFGNAAKVVDLQVCWRNLKPYERRKCASPDQIVSWLKGGQIILPAESGPVENIRKMTITRAVAFYDGNFGGEKQDFVMPYVSLEALLENGENSKTVSFISPITDSH